MRKYSVHKPTRRIEAYNIEEKKYDKATKSIRKQGKYIKRQKKNTIAQRKRIQDRVEN